MSELLALLRGLALLALLLGACILAWVILIWAVINTLGGLFT